MRFLWTRKDQWVKAFPLVRGLALIWSDQVRAFSPAGGALQQETDVSQKPDRQPWFLDVYAKYILSLEEALAIIDRCLPSAHSPDKGRSGSKDDKRLARFIMDCEERASMEGEASLAIAISKPLMRLGKLPLLMQSVSPGLCVRKARGQGADCLALVPAPLPHRRYDCRV